MHRKHRTHKKIEGKVTEVRKDGIQLHGGYFYAFDTIACMKCATAKKNFSPSRVVDTTDLIRKSVDTTDLRHSKIHGEDDVFTCRECAQSLQRGPLHHVLSLVEVSSCSR